MTAVTVRFKGAEDLSRRLRAMPTAIARMAVDVNLQSAEEMAGFARQAAPVRTGALKDSIAVTRGGENTPAFSGARIGRGGGRTAVAEATVAVTAGNNAVRYAHLVEYGTQKAPAQPFFWPAWWRERGRFLRRVAEALKRAA